MQVNMILEQHNSFSIHEPQWVSHGTACSSVSNVNLHTKSSKWVFLHVVLLSSWTTFEAPEKKKKKKEITIAVFSQKQWNFQRTEEFSPRLWLQAPCTTPSCSLLIASLARTTFMIKSENYVLLPHPLKPSS